MSAPVEAPPAAPHPPGPTVAHLRRIWFRRTETFLHHLIRHCRATRPLLIGYRNENHQAFPVDCPRLALYQPGTFAAKWLRLRGELLGERGHTHFAVRRTRAALAAHRARLLHAHFGYTGYRALPVARRARLPLVTTFYGEDVSRQAADPVWRERFAELFAAGDRFLVEGPHMRRRLLEIGCPPHKTSVQRIGIPVASYPFREREPRPRGEPVRLLFCASFREKKGLHFALEAVARVREKHPGLEFRIAGDGPLRDEVERDVGRLGLAGATVRLGFVSHARLLEELHAADLFIQPSVTAANNDSEGGAPTTLLEAQACGVPVLATSHADIPSVVRPGESALLAPERDADALAAGLLALLEEPERWAAMGAAGRAHVERLHDVEATVAQLERLYLELVRTP